MQSNFEALYERIFQGSLFIIKVGGRIILDDTARTNLLADIKKLIDNNVQVLLIYGGGAAIDAAITEAGRTPLKVEGRRITRAEDIEIIKRTLNGDIGSTISAHLSDFDLKGLVLNALPSHIGTATRRPDYEGTKRYDGRVTKADKKEIRNLFLAHNLVICPCLAHDEDNSDVLNINADNIAISLAAFAEAEKLILMTDVDGVLINNEVASVLTSQEIEALIADGTVTGGMQVKLESCVQAVRQGVKRIHILNGFTPHIIQSEVYTTKGMGTMIVRTAEKENYEKELHLKEGE